MNNRVTARYNAAKRTQDFNADNATQLALVEEYLTEQTEFDELIKKLESVGVIQAQDHGAVSTNKTALRSVMGNTLVIFSLRAVIKAHRAGDIILENSVDHSLKYFTEGTATQSINRANAFIELIKSNLSIFTNISAANIAEMETAVAAFNAVKDAPVSVLQTQKVQGTDQIGPLLDQVDVLIEHMCKLVHSYFPNTPLSEEFDLKSRIIVLGVRHNTVSIHLTDVDTGDTIVNGHLVSATTQKNAASDTTGTASFHSVQTGLQSFHVAAPGYLPQDVTIKVIRGSHSEIVVKMKKG